MNFSELKAKAKARLAGNWGVAIGGILVVSLITGLASSCGISILIVGPFALGSAALFLNIVRSEEAKIDNVFEGFKDFGGNFVLGLLQGLFIALWSLLFIIPGIIKTYAWSLAFYLKKDHPEMTWKEALDTSASWMKGHKWELFCLELSFIGWMLLSVLTCGLLLFWLSPYMAATRALYYEKLKEINEPSAPAEETPAASVEDLLSGINL